ncbi:MAG: hypothetical protein ABS98_10115 [Lysobacteraceae bacterium SCN 69-48]|nr:MAG: hypothetical protein ABS98_10115 [Xanthomonadaceae bacterium SCN 69-48]
MFCPLTVATPNPFSPPAVTWRLGFAARTALLNVPASAIWPLTTEDEIAGAVGAIDEEDDAGAAVI